MLVERQNNFMLAKDYPVDIVDAKKWAWMLRDIEPRNKLKIASGLYLSGSALLTGSQTDTLQLPEAYDGVSPLAFSLVASFPVLVQVTTNPSIVSAPIYVFGTNTTTEGEHYGHCCFQQTNVTAITVTNLVGANLAQIAWVMYQIPTLTSPNSWKDGSQTIGAV